MFGTNIETLDHQQWLADTWPEPYRYRHAVDIPSDDAVIEDWAVLPRTLHGMLKFGFVGRNPNSTDNTRSLMFMYRNPHLYSGAPANVLYPVGVRVQGFVERCDLRPLGNWDGSAAPQAALQFVVLSSGNQSAGIFREYINAVQDVKDFIFRTLDQDPPPGNGDDSLFIARRVFSKINSANRALPIALRPGDDPMLRCDRVSKSWRVLNRIKCGMFIQDEHDPEDGDKVACEPQSIVEGDFVDVCVGFDIVTRYNRGVPTHQVHLSLEHLLLLKPRSEGEEIAADAEDSGYAVHAPGMDFA